MNKVEILDIDITAHTREVEPVPDLGFRKYVHTGEKTVRIRARVNGNEVTVGVRAGRENSDRVATAGWRALIHLMTVQEPKDEEWLVQGDDLVPTEGLHEE